MSLNIVTDLRSQASNNKKRKSKRLLDLTLRQVGRRWSKTMLNIVDEFSRVFGNIRPPSFNEGIQGTQKILGKRHRLFYIGITCIFLAIGIFYVHISS